MRYEEYQGHIISVDEPKEVGDCAACGGTMYDHEAVMCESGCGEVHQDCIVKCEGCGAEGCKKCLKLNEEDLCEICAASSWR